jgi:hypothetical protein
MKVESYATRCPECHGERYIGNNQLCPVCLGDGAIVVRPRRLEAPISRRKLRNVCFILAIVFAVALAIALWP